MNRKKFYVFLMVGAVLVSLLGMYQATHLLANNHQATNQEESFIIKDETARQGDWIYYLVENNGKKRLERIKNDGTKHTLLIEQVQDYKLYEDKIYYELNTGLYRANIDGKMNECIIETTQLAKNLEVYEKDFKEIKAYKVIGAYKGITYIMVDFMDKTQGKEHNKLYAVKENNVQLVIDKDYEPSYLTMHNEHIYIQDGGDSQHFGAVMSLNVEEQSEVMLAAEGIILQKADTGIYYLKKDTSTNDILLFRTMPDERFTSQKELVYSINENALKGDCYITEHFIYMKDAIYNLDTEENMMLKEGYKQAGFDILSLKSKWGYTIRENANESILSKVNSENAQVQDIAELDKGIIKESLQLYEEKALTQDEKVIKETVNNEWKKDYIQNKDSYLLEDSNKEKIEGYYMNCEQCAVARDEIYARHGVIFSDPERAIYFKNKAWYTPLTDGSHVKLNEVEQYNVEALEWFIKAMKGNDENTFVSDAAKAYSKVSEYPANKMFELDLDGDGKKEKITVNYTMENMKVTVNGQTKSFDGAWFEPSIQVIDIDKSDSYKELVIKDNGPSDDPVSYFMFFDGNKLINMGVAEGQIDMDGATVVTTGDGLVRAIKRNDIIGYYRYSCTYQLTQDHKLQEIPTKWYKIQRAAMTKKEVTMYESANLNSKKTILLAQTGIVFTQTDGKHWSHIRTQEGEEGWIYVTPYGEGEWPGDLFVGLLWCD